MERNSGNKLQFKQLRWFYWSVASSLPSGDVPRRLSSNWNSIEKLGFPLVRSPVGIEVWTPASLLSSIPENHKESSTFTKRISRWMEEPIKNLKPAKEFRVWKWCSRWRKEESTTSTTGRGKYRKTPPTLDIRNRFHISPARNEQRKIQISPVMKPEKKTISLVINSL